MKLGRHGLTRATRGGKQVGWVKKINGTTRWVASVSLAPNIEAADAIYVRDFAALWKESVRIRKDPPIADMFNAFVDAAEARGISPRTLADYVSACQDFANSVRGKVERPSNLGPAHFAAFVDAIRKRFGFDRRKKWIICIRCAFKWAAESRLIDQIPHYGPSMKVPGRSEQRKSRADRGRRHYLPAEIAKLIQAAKPKMRAMILLALNGGMANTDCALFSRRHMTDGWVDFPRPKTGIARRFPLWDETVKALDQIPARQGSELVFTTKHGAPYIQKGKDQISIRFTALCKAAKVKCFGFRALRRTHRTASDQLGDQRAAALVMGHEAGDVGGLYVEAIDDARLKKLVEHVRTSLKITESCAALSASSRPRARSRRGRQQAAPEQPAQKTASAEDKAASQAGG